MAILNITQDWTMDPDHSSISFTVRHAGISKVRGEFEQASSTAKPSENGEAYVEAVAQTDSFNSKSEGRDAHVKGEDFFDVEKYPEIRFVGHVRGEELVGDLTIKETTLPVSFDITEADTAVDPFGLERIGVEAETTISRKEFGITWNAPLEAGGVLVSDKVKIVIDASYIKA